VISSGRLLELISGPGRPKQAILSPQGTAIRRHHSLTLTRRTSLGDLETPPMNLTLFPQTTGTVGRDIPTTPYRTVHGSTGQPALDGWAGLVTVT